MIRFQRERIYTHAGDRDRPVYKLAYSKVTNADELVCIGKEPWQEFINASEASCDLGVLIARVRSGELEALNQKPGSYGDFRDLPKSKAELLQTMIDSRAFYSNLGDEQKKNFGSYADFLEDAGSAEWLKKLGVEVPSVDVDLPVEKEVSE